MVVGQIHISNDTVREAIESVCDPEVPVLTVMDLGVIRAVEVTDGRVSIKLTPTYTGCPAMDTIATDLKMALAEVGYETDVDLVLSPAWTTDWISPEGRQKLEEYGIAAPLSESMDKSALLDGERVVPCPRCGSTDTKVISAFGSTACKALFQCAACLEPFDYFKCLK